MSQDTLQQILDELAQIKKGLPNGELKRIEKNVEKLNSDVSEIKKMLMNPNDGLIVEVNKNTEWRKERTSKIGFYDEQVHELDKLKEWKSGVTRAIWVGFAAIVGIVVKMFGEAFKS